MTVKTYYITDKYDNELPIEFIYSKNKKWIVFQYARVTCNGYLDGESELHASFIQRDKYADSMVWYGNVVPPDDNRNYEYIGTKREFKLWWTDTNGNVIEPDNFKVFLKLIY